MAQNDRGEEVTGLDDLNSVGRANINITTNGDYTQISQGKNQQISYQGEQKFAGGPSFNINIDAKTQFLADGQKTWTVGRKFEFNNGRVYRVDNKASYTVGKKSSVENRDYILLTAGQSNKRMTNLKSYKTFIMQVPSWFTYLKYVFKLYRWSQFVTKPVVGKSAVYNNKEMLNTVEGFVNNYISVGIKYFQSLVSVMNTSYFTWLNYEKIFHKPNIPTSILQLSSEKGVLLAGGDSQTLNSMEMKNSIHLSSHQSPRVTGLATKEIYKKRDDQKELEGVGDKIERLAAKAASLGFAGKYEQYGEYNGLKDKYTADSFLTIEPSRIRTKTLEHSTIADSIMVSSVISNAFETSYYSVDASNLVTISCGVDLNTPIFVLDPSFSSLTAGASGFAITQDEVLLENKQAQSSVSVKQDGIAVSKGSQSQILVQDDKIEISNKRAKISIANNSVSIGSELKVMGISASSGFKEFSRIKNKLQKLKKQYDKDVKKFEKDQQDLLKKIDSSDMKGSEESKNIWQEFNKLNEEMAQARIDIGKKSDKWFSK